MKFPRFLCLPVLVMLSLRAAEPVPAARFPFQEPRLELEQRVDDLVSRLSLEEKVSLLMMDSPAIPRLGIPAYHWWNEGLHGYARSGVATVFPQAIGLAATWNPELQEKVGEVVSTEGRARYNEEMKERGRSRIYHGLTIWSPNINVFRDPRWGRGQETYGEDPYLAGVMGVAFVRGLQGPDLKHPRTVATLKHYAVHSGPESLRHVFDAKPSPRDLWETYLPAFEMGVEEGKALSLMSVYNAIDGVPGPANERTLTTILRKRWHFQGAVVGDVDTVADVWSSHKYAKDAAEASALCLKAGNDLCSGGTYYALPEALKRGLVSVADVDVALARLLGLRFRLGQFDPAGTGPFDALGKEHIDTAANAALALETARQSMVLLKNDGALPWDVRKLHTVAIIGPTGDDQSALLGNYAGTPSAPVTLQAGLRARLEAQGVKVLSEAGTRLVDGYVKDQLPGAGTLFTSADLGTPGLRFEAFENRAFEGKAIADKTDDQLSRRWNSYTFAGDVPQQNAALRWSGVLVAPEDGDYEFVLTSDGSAKLELDGKVLLQEAAMTEANPLVGKIRLVKGRPVQLRLEFSQVQDHQGSVALRWRTPLRADAYAAAMEAARQADQVVLTLGITPDLEGEEMPVKLAGFDGGDRTSLQLPAVQQRLLADVAALGKPVTVVLTTGSALILDTAKANAVLCAWYYGQQGGRALADILLGETNPSGRLPVTFYAADADLPSFTDYSMEGRTYRYFQGKPLYAFGHGLSYTAFEYTGLSIAARPNSSGVRDLRVSVRNAGTREGDEVVQVYASEQGHRQGRALRQLIAFKRIHLKQGETAELSIPVEARRLAHWDESRSDYVVEPTDYLIAVGPSSDKAALTQVLSLGK